MQDTYIDRGFCIFLMQMLKTVIISFINWSEHFIWWGCFQVCSGNNNTSLLLNACEDINLINKGVISPYIKKYGEILLKFNIFSLHYIRHYCASNKCQLFKTALK